MRSMCEVRTNTDIKSMLEPEDEDVQRMSGMLTTTILSTYEDLKPA